MKKELILAIFELLAAKVPELLWLDVWNSQTVNWEKQHGIPLPAAFVELAFPNKQALARGVKKLDVVVRVHLVQHVWETQHVPGQKVHWNPKALDWLDLTEQVNAVLDNSEVCGGRLLATGEEPDNDHDALVRWVLTYTLIVNDCSAHKHAGWVEAEIDCLDTPRGRLGAGRLRPFAGTSTEEGQDCACPAGQ